MQANPVLNQDRWQAAAGYGVDARVDTSRMTLGGTALATGVLLAIVAISGTWGYGQVTQTTTVVPVAGGGTQEISTASPPGWMFLCILGGLGLALVTVFKPQAARFTAPLYALLYGAAVGAISALYNFQTEGIVLQAVLASVATAAVVFLLYVFRVIRATRRFVLTVVAATGGIFVMYIVGFVASLFGANLYFWNQPTPLGIAISVGICIVAAMNLIVNFGFIEAATEAGSPKYMEWFGAFGVTVTLIWLYLEILRLISLLNRS